MSQNKPKNIFIQGPITAEFIGEAIAKHQSKTNIGGHSIFLGQVRADEVNEKRVIAIEYTAYEAMALEQMDLLREALIKKYQLTCMHVYHSLGRIATGEICLFVFTSSPHRKAAMEACNEAVEAIKANLPIWGKEIMEDTTHQWKLNK